MEFERRSSGVAKAGLATGIVGTSLGTLGLLGAGANGLGNLLGRTPNVSSGCGDALVAAALASGMYGCSHGRSCCDSDQYLTRYDAEKDAEIARLRSDIALRDANTFTDQKNLEMYRYVDGRLREIEGQLAQQAVYNQATNDKFQLAKQELDCCCARLEEAIKSEARERCCGDNSIITYVNSTFYPHLVADITAAATTTPQALFNPVKNCGSRCCDN